MDGAQPDQGQWERRGGQNTKQPHPLTRPGGREGGGASTREVTQSSLVEGHTPTRRKKKREEHWNNLPETSHLSSSPTSQPTEPKETPTQDSGQTPTPPPCPSPMSPALQTYSSSLVEPR